MITGATEAGRERRRGILQALSHRPMTTEQIRDWVQPYVSLDCTRLDMRWLLAAGLVRRKRMPKMDKGPGAPQTVYVRTRRRVPLPLATGRFSGHPPV